ncbi:MAG: redox-regulated ATPase YchF [Nanopusillaceae archaeon]
MLIGLTGKPNVGKSTMFKAITLQDVAIANYPFTTIEPNKGVGYVRVEDVGPEFGVQSNPRYGYIKGKYRFVPIEIIDIAGLVPGAHEGRGLGNKFLDDVRQADALIHVVDISGSTNEEGQYTGPGNYDPINDIQWYEDEINWWFFNIIKKNLEKNINKIKLQHLELDKELAKLISGLNVKQYHIEKAFRELNISNEDYDIINDDKKLFELSSKIRKISKPIVIAANRVDINIDIAKKNLERLKEKFPDKIIIPTSGYAELILKELDRQGKIYYIPGEGSFEIKGELNEKEKKALEFIENNIFKEFKTTGVQNLLDITVFDVLKYVAVFPGGIDSLADKEGRILPDCFLLPPESTVIDFAAKIHTDLAKNFVKAIDVRTKKFLGRDYVLKHRDIIQIIANA